MACAKDLFRRVGLALAGATLSAFFLVSMGTPCRAAGTLDQEFVPSPANVTSLWSNTSLGQTFTVGLNGIFTGFDVYFSNPSSITSGVTWELQSTISGLPDGTVLDSGTIAGTSLSPVNQWVSIDVSSSAIGVASGEVYAIVMTGQVLQYDPALRWLSATLSNATYAGGERVNRTNPSGSWGTNANVDFGFRTYVPEPSQTSLTLVALCTLLAGAWIRGTAIEN